MLLPSGENAGCCSPIVLAVSGRMFPLSTSSSWTVLWPRSPEWTELILTKAISLPSGDHDGAGGAGPGGNGAGSVQLPEVRRRAGDPSDAASHRCTGRGTSTARKLLRLISKERLNFSSPSLLSASSTAVYAIAPPSGRQA